MLAKENALQLIYTSLQEINSSRSPEMRLVLSPHTKLLDQGGELDSLDVVEMVVVLEERLARHLNQNVRLLDERLISQEQPPLRDVDSLANFLTQSF